MRPSVTTPVTLLVLFLLACGGGSACGQSEVQKRFQALEQQAAAASPEARKEAAKALAEFGWVVSVPILQKLLDDPDAAVQREALLALRGPLKKSGLLPLPSERVGPKSPYWDGTTFQNKIGGRLEALTARVKKLGEQDDAEVRAAAKDILRCLEIRAAAASLKLRPGRGEARTADPSNKVKVANGEVLDAAGKTLAHLTGRHESASCWTFSADGRLLAVGFRFDSAAGQSEKGGGGTVKGGLRLYDAQTGEPLGGAGGYFGPITHVAFDKDGQTLLYEMSEIKEIGGK